MEPPVQRLRAPRRSGITARRVTSDWDELELTWSDQPSVTSVGTNTEYGGYKSATCAGSFNYKWNLIHLVNTIVQAWANGEPNYGIQLTAGNESDITNWRRYRTRESTYPSPTHAPRLSVDFERPAPARQETVVIAVPEPLDTLPTNYDEAVAMSTRTGTTAEEFASIDVPDAVLNATLANHNGMADTVGTDKLTPDDPNAPEPDDTGGSGAEDILAPRVLTHEPAADALDVPLDAVVRMTFTEPVGFAEARVRATDGTAVLGSLAYSNEDRVMMFTPAQPLEPGTTYPVEVAWAMDGSENTMEPYSWSFRIVDQAAGRWTFDEGSGSTAADSSGNDHDASLNDTRGVDRRQERERDLQRAVTGADRRLAVGGQAGQDGRGRRRDDRDEHHLRPAGREDVQDRGRGRSGADEAWQRLGADRHHSG
ncbi:DNRLRE domain-containing protein [Nonomuraea insulae]|uniref:DNRLRE domain-containing protein n=1 Tax=Nonomuraea insulae TaxID=1616787 RepID=A0ABW1D072_9ACTN